MSSIYKNRGWWYYQTMVSVDGKRNRIQKSLRTKIHREAVRLQKLYDQRYEQQLKNPFSKNHLLISQSIDNYLDKRKKKVKNYLLSFRTYESDKLALNHLKNFLYKEYGDIYIDEITKKQIRLFKEKREDEVKPTTVAINLRHIKSFFSYLKRTDLLETNPTEGIKTPPYERREIVPTDDDWYKLYNYLEEKVRQTNYSWFETLLFVLMNTGMRIGETAIAKWDRGKNDYGRNLSKNYVYLSNDKKQITIYYKKGLRSIPVEHIIWVFEKIPKTYTLFKGKKKEITKTLTYVFENPITQSPHNLPQMSRMFKKLMRNLDLSEDYTPHSIRHGFTSTILKNGGNLFYISKILGHSVQEITEFIYAHHSTDDLKDTINKINLKN